RSGIVLATGGGAVIDKDNRTALANNGIVIYLEAPVSELLKRTARDKNRPLLQIDNPKAKLEALLHEREAFYQEVADLVINTGHRSAKDVVKEILEKTDSIVK
ncbi:MAG: shikimate kinase, partial [Gammaproteobacteria bacterium]|nr:shikimate kinase [Gammaproteobacteria bacterium]